MSGTGSPKLPGVSVSYSGGGQSVTANAQPNFRTNDLSVDVSRFACGFVVIWRSNTRQPHFLLRLLERGNVY